eukprot:TRINITY_DN27031_c0_g1_i1.p1 TRINITY_DN27031_c0_g1~~TRINITY_DN27031_c0_g1_i1.p1  ORF type:complete len:119 (-),score=16.61 TRINITY_DN27031_c0_g1_i1:315-671(-)
MIKNKHKKHRMPSINIGASRSQQIQKQKYRKKQHHQHDAAYHAEIGADFVPYDEEQKLNQQIRGINEDLQYLLEINKSVNHLVHRDQHNVDDIERKVADSKDNVEQGMNAITSIHKSP